MRIIALLASVVAWCFLLENNHTRAAVLEVEVRHTFHDEPLLLDSLRYRNAAGEMLSFERLSYLLSGFALEREEGGWVDIPDGIAWFDAARRRTSARFGNVPESALEGFAVCGQDHAWKWAVARIEGDSVVVQADGVAEPVAVRYAWADDPLCNLYNGAGFPAAPFRTDDFPAITRNNRF